MSMQSNRFSGNNLNKWVADTLNQVVILISGNAVTTYIQEVHES